MTNGLFKLLLKVYFYTVISTDCFLTAALLLRMPAFLLLALTLEVLNKPGSALIWSVNNLHILFYKLLLISKALWFKIYIFLEEECQLSHPHHWALCSSRTLDIEKENKHWLNTCYKPGAIVQYIELN